MTYSPEQYQKQKPAIVAAQRRYYQATIEERRRYQREYSIKNRERIIEYQRQYRAKKKAKQLIQ
jgi:hypothetical protein